MLSVDTNILEEMRGLHEERERLLMAMADEQYFVKKSKREEINSSYRIKGLLERYKEVSQILITSYKDKEEALKVDFKDITPQNSLSTFLKQVDSIKESSRQVGLSSEANTIKPLSAEFSKFAEGRANLNKLVLCEFTGEEGYGRYLDLSMLHIQYNNLPSLPKKLTYVKYLEEFNKFSELDLSIKQSAAYKSYLLSLKNYLVNFVERIQPLLDSKCEIDKISKQFENEWQTNTYKGWTDEYFEKSIKQQSKMLNEPINLALFDKPEQLETLGNEKLRASLSNLGLKSGGTLQEKAIRLFSTKDKPIESLDPSLFPNKKSKHKTKINSVVELKDKLKSVALSEAVICAFTEMLTKEREDTKNDVIRKQSLTAEERLLEQANDSNYENLDGLENGIASQINSNYENNDEADFDDYDDNEDVTYNPKNLPLGADGRPIPYWLYKLHGLNLKFSCEICGNHTYLGPKAFMRHFSEWRHSHGMRCLGIPNTAHFANVTLIEDAMAIWDKMCKERESAVWKADDEEFEDTSSNVITRRMYNDLYRQGFL